MTGVELTRPGVVREERIAEFPTTVVIIIVNRAGSLSFETVRAG